MKKLFLTLFCIGASASLFAAVISGDVKDSAGSPLPGTTVRLSTERDSVQKAFTISDDNGMFVIDNIATGDYTLHISMVGMDPVVKTVSIKDADERVNTGTIILTEEAKMLKETVVTAVKAAVVAKQDTMEFNAGSFKVQTNANVEDLLKKLPGVEVDSDGKITSGGKTVSKILVDGKELFGDDTKMATRNLPSDLVDKVQVVDRKSDLARLTGVDDGEEETIINLTVKKSMMNGWFGTVSAGYGTSGRYEGSLNASTISDTNQLMIIGGGNNVNQMGFTDMGRGRFMSFGPAGGINSSQQLGLNFNVGKSEKFRVGGNVLYSHSDNHAISQSDVQYLFPDSTSYMTQGTNSRDIGHNVRGDFRMEWKMDEYNTLDFRPQFSLNFRNSELNDTSLLRAGDASRSEVNRNETRRFNRGFSYNAAGELIFNHNFKARKGRSFSVQARYEFADTKEHTTTWNDIIYFMKQDETESLYRYIDNKNWNNNVSARLTWTEPLGDVTRGNFLQFAYRISYRWNNADRYTYDLPLPEDMAAFIPSELTAVPSDAVRNDSLSNVFRNKFSTQELRIGYKKVTNMYNLEAGMIFSPSSTTSTDLMNAARDIETRWVWNVAPFVRFRYRFSKTKSIRVNYRANTSSPSVSQLQPVADVSDPLNIKIGNPDLKPTFTQSIGVNFNNYNTDTQQAIFASIRGSYAMNVVVSRTFTDPETGARTITYTNANGNASANAMFMINQPFTNRHWRFSGNAFLSYENTAGYINGDFNRSGNLRVNPRFGITYSCDVAQVSINPIYSFTLATSSLASQRNRTTHNYGLRGDATITLPFGLQFATDLTFDKSMGFSQGFNTESWLWNAKISYSMLKDKSLTISVRAYDLLGMNRNISRSVSASMITDNRYNDLTRYFMFGISYRFNTLKSKKRNETGENYDNNPGPPPGGMRPMGPPPVGGRPPF